MKKIKKWERNKGTSKSKKCQNNETHEDCGRRERLEIQEKIPTVGIERKCKGNISYLVYKFGTYDEFRKD